MATKKLLGTLARYGWKSGVHKNDDARLSWEYVVVTPTETWGATTEPEANKLYKTLSEGHVPKPFSQWMDEDAPANAAGGGGVAGIGIGVKGEPGVDLRKKRKDLDPLAEDVQPSDTFAGADVFEVDTGTFMKGRFGKNRYHRYSKYVGETPTGEAIRKHGRGTKRDIVLKDGATGAMTFFRRKKTLG